MKTVLRVTKGRIACAIVALPVLYVLNIGPIFYCMKHFGLSPEILDLYHPLVKAMEGTPLLKFYESYIIWWLEFPPVVQDAPAPRGLKI